MVSYYLRNTYYSLGRFKDNMLFYMTKEEGIENIPSSYNIIIISNHIKTINHPNSQKANFLLPKKNINDNKQDYKKFLKSKLSVIVMITQLLRLPSAQSVVLVCDEADIDYYDFNYVKRICKFISKRYGTEYFKFTNNVSRDMRERSKLSEDGVNKLILDLSKFKEDLINGTL